MRQLHDTMLENIYEEALSVLEKPTKEEGFSTVTEIDTK